MRLRRGRDPLYARLDGGLSAGAGQKVTGRLRRPHRLARARRSGIASLPLADAQRRVAREQGVLILAVAGAAAWLSSPAQWSDPALIASLFVLALVGDRLGGRVGDIHVSLSDPGLVLLAALCGPAPAVAAAFAVIGLDAASGRIPRHMALVNFATFGSAALAAGAFVQALTRSGTAEPGSWSFVLAVAGALAVFKLVDSSLLLYARGRSGHPRRAELRGSIIPLLPLEGVGIVLAAGAAHMYATLGFAVVPGLLATLVLLRLLLSGIVVAERRQQEIAQIAADRDRHMREALLAEERERRRIAAELHDDALQTLLSARADLVTGLSGDEDRLVSARESVAATLTKLRDLMTRLGPLPAPERLGPALRALAARIDGRASFTTRVLVDGDLDDVRDDLLVAAGRELLVNAARHANARQVDVIVSRRGGVIALEVRDDGAGFGSSACRPEVEAGHVGLALLAQRAESRGGSFAVESPSGGGVLATLLVPAAPAARTAA